MSLHSIPSLAKRATDCPKSVALFTDSQLVSFAKDQIESNAQNSDLTVLGHVLAEMLVRLWLYKQNQANEIRATVTTIASKLLVNDLVERFDATVAPLRKLSGAIEHQDAIDLALNHGSNWESTTVQIWDFLAERVRAFLECSGVIAAAIGGDAVAIPFSIKPDIGRGKICDSAGSEIKGWIAETPELWKVLGRRFGVLPCTVPLETTPYTAPVNAWFPEAVLLCLSCSHTHVRTTRRYIHSPLFALARWFKGSWRRFRVLTKRNHSHIG